MRLLVEHDRVLAADQAGNRPQVRQHHRRIDQDRLDPEPVGEFFFGIDIRPDAGERPRGAVMRSPAPQSAAHGRLDPRVVVQPEETVRAEVDNTTAPDHDLAPGPPRPPPGPSSASPDASRRIARGSSPACSDAALVPASPWENSRHESPYRPRGPKWISCSSARRYGGLKG